VSLQYSYHLCCPSWYPGREIGRRRAAVVVIVVVIVTVMAGWTPAEILRLLALLFPGW